MGTAELPASRAVTALQVEEIVHQNDVQFTHNSTEDVRQAALSEKTRLAHDRLQREQNDFVTIKSSASPALARRLESLSTKSVSSWLGVLPLADHGHHLSKGDFRDAPALRYGWSLLDTPASCVCREPFDATHAMICLLTCECACDYSHALQLLTRAVATTTSTSSVVTLYMYMYMYVHQSYATLAYAVLLILVF